MGYLMNSRLSMYNYMYTIKIINKFQRWAKLKRIKFNLDNQGFVPTLLKNLKYFITSHWTLGV